MKTIRELRESRRLTQRSLANEIGVTTATVYNWERRQREPRASQVRAMAKLFAVSMDDIDFEVKQKRGHPQAEA